MERIEQIIEHGASPPRAPREGSGPSPSASPANL
jgi:hypothetical protein